MLSGDTSVHRTFFLCVVCVFLAGVGILLWSLRTPSQTLKTVHQPTSPEVQSSGEALPTSSRVSQSPVTHKQAATKTPLAIADSLDYNALAKAYLNNTTSGFDYQEFADFTAEQGGEKIDFRQIFQEIYQDFYPNTDPEALDGEMERLIHETLADVIKEGDNSKIMEAAYSFWTEPESAVWVMGRFEGNMGAFMDWYSDVLEKTPPPTISEVNRTVFSHEIDPSYAESDWVEIPDESMEADSKNTDSKNIGIHRESIEVSEPTVIDSGSSILSSKQESLIRETLSRYGIDEGLFQLAETDSDTLERLLQRFKSLEELEEWHRSGDRGRHQPASDENEESPQVKTPGKRGQLEGEMSSEYDE